MSRYQSSININVDKTVTIGNIQDIYFQSIDIPSKYNLDKFYFFVNDKKANIETPIINFLTGLYNIIEIVVLYDIHNTFSDLTNIMICGKDYSTLKKDFYTFISYNKSIFDIKKEIVNYLSKYDIERNVEQIVILFYGKCAKDNKLIKDYTGCGNSVLYIFKY